MYTMLELFSGSGRIGNYFRSKGWKVISVDYNKRLTCDLCCNVYDHLDISYYESMFDCKIDFIWASPDCATYSLAAGNIHRYKGGIPHSDYAKYCDLHNALLFNWLKSLRIPFIVENPHGFMCLSEFVKGCIKYELTYGSYKDGKSYKPTDFFSNMFGLIWLPKVNKKFFHQVIYKVNNYLDRCYMPYDLIVQIYDNVDRFLDNGNKTFTFKQLSLFDLEEV